MLFIVSMEPSSVIWTLQLSVITGLFVQMKLENGEKEQVRLMKPFYSEGSVLYYVGDFIYKEPYQEYNAQYNAK